MKRTSLGIDPGIRIFPAFAAGLLLFIAAGSSPAADFPAGSAPAATDNAAVPVAPAVGNGWVDRTHSRIERDLTLRAEILFTGAEPNPRAVGESGP